MKKIHVGTTNDSKLRAVRKACENYFERIHYIPGYVVAGFKCESSVPDQPLTENDCLTGAENRALRAYTTECDFSIGIESGCRTIRDGLTVEATYIAIWDGTRFYYGISPAWQVSTAMKKLLDEGLDLSQVAVKLGMTTSGTIGSEIGIVGLVTKSPVSDYMITREEYTKQGIEFALVNYFQENQ